MQPSEIIQAVDNSRNALRLEYQAGAAHPPPPDSSAPGDAKPKRGRKPKDPECSASPKSHASATTLTAKGGQKLTDRVIVAPEQVSEAPVGKTREAAGAKKERAKPPVKYKNPNSDKTWSGLGRRPAWFSGEANQSAIDTQGGNTASESKATAETPQVGLLKFKTERVYAQCITSPNGSRFITGQQQNGAQLAAFSIHFFCVRIWTQYC